MSVASENEALKLTASLMNTISGALFGAGVILPLLNQMVGTNPLALPALVLLSIACAAGATAIHLLGRFILLAGIQ